MSPKLIRQALHRHPSRPQAQDADSGSPRSPEQAEITKRKGFFSEITKRDILPRNGRQKWVTLFSVGEGDGAPTRPSARRAPAPLLSGSSRVRGPRTPPPLPRPARRPLTAARGHEAAARARARASFTPAAPPYPYLWGRRAGRRRKAGGGGRQRAGGGGGGGEARVRARSSPSVSGGCGGSAAPAAAPSGGGRPHLPPERRRHWLRRSYGLGAVAPRLTGGRDLGAPFNPEPRRRSAAHRGSQWEGHVAHWTRSDLRRINQHLGVLGPRPGRGLIRSARR